MPTVADHAIDESKNFYDNAGAGTLHNHPPFNPSFLEDGDLIFVKTDYIINGMFRDIFLNKIHKDFNLITGISSYNIGRDGNDSYKDILNHPKLNKWFCTNPLVENGEMPEKIVPLPIGFEEPRRIGGDQNMLQEVFSNRTPRYNKEDKILLPYHEFSTNPKRKRLYDNLSRLDFVDVQTDKLPIHEYLKLLDNYKFVICLEGRGPDVHRNYESMIVGAIPINVNPVIQKLFEYYSIEGIFLESWESLDQDMYKKILNQNYDLQKNDNFLLLDNHKKFIKKVVKNED